MNRGAVFSRLAPTAAAGILLAAYFLLATTAAANKSNTFDEIAHFTAGYAYWTLDDYRFQPENGNLPQRLAALPAVIEGARFPSLDDPDWRQSDVYAFGRKFFFESGNDIDRLLARGRAVITLIGVALGALVFIWSRRLNGTAGGFVSLVLFVLCPTLLAHGPQCTSDMAAAFALLASTLAVWLLLERVTVARLVTSLLAAAMLFLSKFSAPVLAVMALVLAIVRAARRQPTEVSFRGRTLVIATLGRRISILLVLAATHLLVVWIAVWASYGFRYSAFHQATGNDQLLVDWTLVLSESDGVTRSVIGSAIDEARTWRVLPESYLYGFAHTVKFAQSRRAFMDGEYSLTGWTSFFPYAFSIKTTLPLLALVAIGIVHVLRDRRRLWDASPALILIGVYWVFAIATNLNIGHRHLLPIYPALFILAGAVGTTLSRVVVPAPPAAPPAEKKRGKRDPRPARPASSPASSRIVAIVSVTLLMWHAVESFRVRPHYLAYFNQLAGGPSEGYRHLVDSSLDWGQDLPTLRAWLDEHAPAGSARPPVYLSYFGTGSPAHEGIDATILESYLRISSTSPVPTLQPGIYCLSATMLQGVYLAVNGPWTTKSEETYRMMSTLAKARASARNEEDRARLEAATGNSRPEFWSNAIRLYDELRTARLMAYLRKRPPDDNAGYSILIHKLSQADLDAALEGPPPY